MMLSNVKRNSKDFTELEHFRFITWGDWPDYENSTMRLGTMLDWFESALEPINLGMLHIEEPDHTGHVYGPDSQEMIDKLLELDELIG